MKYSQDITINKDTFSKYDLLNYYNDFLSILSDLNIKPIQLILDVYLSSNEVYNFSKIDDFKNEIHVNDKIKSVTLILFCGIKNTYSISLSPLTFYSKVRFISINKAWVDEIAHKYKNHFKNENLIGAIGNNESVTHHDSIFNNKEIIGVISIIVMIIIAVLGWTVFK